MLFRVVFAGLRHGPAAKKNINQREQQRGANQRKSIPDCEVRTSRHYRCHHRRTENCQKHKAAIQCNVHCEQYEPVARISIDNMRMFFVMIHVCPPDSALLLRRPLALVKRMTCCVCKSCLGDICDRVSAIALKLCLAPICFERRIPVEYVR